MPLPITPSPSGGQIPKQLGAPWIWQVLYILYCLEVGVFLIFLPWLSIWDNNYLLFRYPAMGPWVTNPFFKGAVLGLGIVNIIIGVQEIARIRRGSRQPLAG